MPPPPAHARQLGGGQLRDGVVVRAGDKMVVRVLLHQGSAGFGGTAMDIAIQADDLRQTRDTVLACIAADTGQPLERIEEDSRRDRWFSASEALAYGFVDAIAEGPELLPNRQHRIGLGDLR